MTMYTLTVRREFVAQHFLIGGDWGEENDWHSHHYRVEVRLEGERLDRHGYLVDIVDVERHLDDVVRRYRDKTLNELPEFEGLNPSVERFAAFFWQQLAERLDAPDVALLEVILWENDIASASFARALPVAESAAAGG